MEGREEKIEFVIEGYRKPSTRKPLLSGRAAGNWAYQWSPRRTSALGSPGFQAARRRGSGSRRPHAHSPRLPCATADAGGSGPFRPPRTLGLPGRRHPAAWGQSGSARPPPPPPRPTPAAIPGPGSPRVGSRPAQGPAGQQSRGLNGEQVPAPARLSAWGWGGTSRLTPCLSPAPFSPFLPPRDGSPRARRKPGSSQRPPSGRTTPAPAGSLQRDAAKEHRSVARIWTQKTPVSRKYSHLSNPVIYMHSKLTRY
ncbi:basic proline-rich protein-like [Sagmatias obliquidens]|uniref:basic proline-rich protein-like n=1 Tax=Sagmatias obliquidens TaxID=3371155 RepID=UPI000F44468E|nr:basic proline-rich protein-like [Lagenorhynchus obliquidens]